MLDHRETLIREYVSACLTERHALDQAQVASARVRELNAQLTADEWAAARGRLDEMILEAASVFVESGARAAEVKAGEPIRYVITLHSGARFYCAAGGRIIYDGDRNMGPFSEDWSIQGFLRRHNSNRVIPLCQEDIDKTDLGHGWVVDVDHGTRRLWGNPSSRRALKVEVIRRVGRERL